MREGSRDWFQLNTWRKASDSQIQWKGPSHAFAIYHNMKSGGCNHHCSVEEIGSDSEVTRSKLHSKSMARNWTGTLFQLQASIFPFIVITSLFLASRVLGWSALIDMSTVKVPALPHLPPIPQHLTRFLWPPFLSLRFVHLQMEWATPSPYHHIVSHSWPQMLSPGHAPFLLFWTLCPLFSFYFLPEWSFHNRTIYNVLFKKKVLKKIKTEATFVILASSITYPLIFQVLAWHSGPPVIRPCKMDHLLPIPVLLVPLSQHGTRSALQHSN